MAFLSASSSQSSNLDFDSAILAGSSSFDGYTQDFPSSQSFDFPLSASQSTESFCLPESQSTDPPFSPGISTQDSWLFDSQLNLPSEAAPSSPPEGILVVKEGILYQEDSKTGKLSAYCRMCDSWIRTGSRIPNPGPLQGHQGSGRACKPKQRAQTMEVQAARQVRIQQLPPTSPPHVSIFGSRAQNQAACMHLPAEHSHTHGCPGIALKWPLDDQWQSYPWHRHSPTGSGLGYKFCAVDTDGVTFRIRSDHCLQEYPTTAGACLACLGLPATIARLSQMAEDALPHTNYSYLSREQLVARLRGRDELVNVLRLKNLTLGRRCAVVVNKLTEYSRFIMALAEEDIPRLRVLIQQCLASGASISQILRKVEECLEGLYQARGYVERDLDLGVLVLRLGGRGLLYALNQHIAIPSIRTLRRSCAFTRLLPCLGTPRREEILWNMVQIFDSKKQGALPFSSGMTLVWDEVSAENRIEYFPHANAAGGVAREDANKVSAELATFENAVTLGQALADGTVRYGKEISVIALTSFGTALRGAFPVLISPTCKAESPSESAALLEMVIAAWNSYGGSIFGWIWSFASDGDAGRRAMVYQMFMKHQITASHTLWKYLGRLSGLNLLVGDHDITGDFDWKHILKRIGRLLRTNEGIMVDNTIINFEMLRWHLQHCGEYSDHEIDIMLNPADSQDVPRAVEFLDAIGHLSTLSPQDMPNPLRRQEARIISVIGEMFIAFMHPYIRPHTSLTEAVVSYSKFAHIACILFRQNRINFMPYQLYGDMQTAIKNCVFCIAKQQAMNGLAPFYPFWTGDDRLEILFGRCRMQGGHNPNFGLKDFVERLGSAVDIDAVFSRHPDWDKGHRRLKVSRVEHADHLNPESWTGNVTANSVDLTSAWRQGQLAATECLSRIGKAANFEDIFDNDRATDLMKPFGDGHYPGVSSAFDRSQEPVNAAPSSETPGNESTISLPPNTTTELQDGPSSPETDFLDDVGFTDHIDELDEADLRAQFQTFNTDKVSAWLTHDGHKIHKASICRIVINPEYIRKSHERTLRVRGFTADMRSRTSVTDNLIDSDSFIVGDLFATFLCCGERVHLAIMKSIELEEKGARKEQVRSSDLIHPAASIKLTGQVLTMQSVDDSKWRWTGDFVRLALEQRNTVPLVGKSVRKTLAIKVCSNVCIAINPHVNTTSSADSDDDDDGLTWELSSSELCAIDAQLWEIVHQTNTVSDIARFRSNDDFPYRDSSGQPALASELASHAVTTLRGIDQAFRCYQCHEIINDPKRIRNHVGHHILKAMRGVDEDLPGSPVDVQALPCGVCGRSGIKSCSEVYLTKAHTAHPQAVSNCQHFHEFKYGPSLDSTVTTPCTNVPVLCTIGGTTCSATIGGKTTAIWKYNMAEHIRTHHPGYRLTATSQLSINGILDDDSCGASLPDSLLRAMHISAEEERVLGIPQKHIPAKSLPRPPAPSTDTRSKKRALASVDHMSKKASKKARRC